MIAIDYDAIEKNTQFFKKRLGETMLCAVVKNNAYGHGLQRAARYMSPYTDYFAVGSADEAEQISFLNKNVLILLPQNESGTKKAAENGYILNIDSFETLKTAERASLRCGKSARVHIKIDSGMNRLGFRYEDLDRLIDLLKYSDISAEGVFSHFYGDTRVQCDMQFEYFMKCVEKLQNGLNKLLIRHIANTSGALLDEKYHLDMARIGLGLYGYGNKELIPSKEVTAGVISVKKIKAGESVGYGAVFTPDTDADIAVIDCGYADGLARTLRGEKVFVNGRYCPVVAVCMAMSMVDVTAVKTDVGDNAVLLGKNVNMANDEIIVYELLCNLRK